MQEWGIGGVKFEVRAKLFRDSVFGSKLLGHTDIDVLLSNAEYRIFGDAESTVMGRSWLDLDGVVAMYSGMKARKLDLRADLKLS